MKQTQFTQKPQFLDVIQLDPKAFNVEQETKLNKVRETQGEQAYRDITWSKEHHPLKATKSYDFRLNEEELSKLLTEGLVFKNIKSISAWEKGPKTSFAKQYLNIYNNDLPVMITSDSILYALHKFYDNYLKNLEQTKMINDLKKLCQLMLDNLRLIEKTSENESYLLALEVFFMVPNVLLSLNHELTTTTTSTTTTTTTTTSNSDGGIISETHSLLFSKEECKQLLEESVTDERIKNEEAEGYNIDKSVKREDLPLKSFFKHLYPEIWKRQNEFKRYKMICNVSKSPKLFTAVRNFKAADINEPIKFKFGGRNVFDKLIKSITTNSDMEFDFCGVTMRMDGTQFKPRGHYTDSFELKKYFMAFTWLSKFEVSLDRKEKEVENAVVLSSLIAKLSEKHSSELNQFQKFISKIVGQSDGYSVCEFLDLINQIIPSECQSIDKAVSWILNHKSEMTESFFNSKNLKKCKLTKYGDVIGEEMTSVSFSLIGKGNPIDNVIIQNLVDDRLTEDKGRESGQNLRKFPSIFDVVFSLFGNSSIEHHVKRRMNDMELHQRDGYQYSDHLNSLKYLAEEHSYTETLYEQELKMMRALTADRKLAEEKGMFPFNKDSWGRKQAQTQTAHYAELRHDNVLYVDEACGGSCECSYPDLQVEPVPTFWKEMLVLVRMMKDMIALEPQKDESRRRRRDLSDIDVLCNFETMILKFLKFLEPQLGEVGKAIDEKLRDELTTIINIKFLGSGETQYGGWYITLFHSQKIAFDQSPEVSSMFTGVTDERGVGGIVHLGTGYPRIMYCLSKNEQDKSDSGKVFVGPTYSVYEVVTSPDNRLNDDDWKKQYSSHTAINF